MEGTEEKVVERIRKEVSKDALTVSRVYKSDYQKDKTITAEIRQTVTTKSYYPSASIANSHQDNIFGNKDFGFEEQEYTNNEKRVAWIDVPEGTSAEQVQAKLNEFKGATLYKMLSNNPILTDNQVYGIKAGLTTKDILANSQVVRFPEGSTDDDGNPNAGKIALDMNGKPQYRAVFFSNSPKEDIDNRNSDMADAYYSPEIKSELENSNVVTGQSI